jgi:uncharacterized protein YgiM (DUF1202 family)
MRKRWARFSALIAQHSLLVILAACASAPPPPAPPPAAVPPPPPPAAPSAIGVVRVVTNTLNVRSAPSLDGEILTQVKKGERLAMLEDGESWIRIRLDDGTTGWVSRSLITVDGEKVAKAAKKPRKSSCPPDSDFTFAKSPTPSFSEAATAKHGLVVVEAYVNVKGDVTSTKIVSNTTGDESLAFLAQREMKESKFVAPVRNCVTREFIFTYRRSF